MNKFIKIGFVAIIVCFAIKGVSVFAQNNIDRTALMFHEIQQKFDLSDEQIDQIKPIHKKYREQSHTLWFGGGVEDPAAFSKEMQATQEEGLSKILSEEQIVQFHEIVKYRLSRGYKHEKAEYLEKALKEYFSKNIMPVVRAQRGELDKIISSIDRDRIDEIRAKAKEVHPRRKDGRRGNIGHDWDKERDGDRANDQDSERNRSFCYEEYSENRLAFINLMKEVKDLMVKYEREIENSLEPIRVEKESWNEEISQIIKENTSSEEVEKVKRIQDGTNRKMFRWIAGKKYLLLDPNGKEDVKDIDVQVRNLDVFPNPAKGFNTFEFEVLESGNVAIVIYNRQGKLIKTVMDEYKKAGDHSIEVSLEGLSEGVYFYQILDRKGDDSQIFMVK